MVDNDNLNTTLTYPIVFGILLTIGTPTRKFEASYWCKLVLME